MTAASFFGANIQILVRNQSYFDPNIKTNYLLHLWSLGVEEQFYFIWPFIIMLVVKTFNKNGFMLLVWFTIISFLSNISSIQFNEKIAFFLPFCRFWQMSIGGLIAYKNPKISGKFLGNLLSIISIIAISITVYYLTEDNLFPGFWALIPTISAASIILAGGESSFNKNILSSAPFVFLGKISYPLYLWHWPLIVYS